MSRNFSSVVAAGAAALAIFTTYPAAADDRPSSVSESGPSRASHHDASPTQRAADARGRSSASPRAGSGSYEYGSRSYEVQTPSSVNESAPYSAGDQMIPTMRGAR